SATPPPAQSSATTIGLIISSGWFLLTTTSAKAMVAIVRSMGWNYVTAIYDEGTYGERGFQEFKSHASQQGICINKYLAETLRLLFGQLGSRLTKRSFFWVASDGWGRKTEHLLGEQFLAEGAISLLPARARRVAGFDQYFRNLTEDHAQVNSWGAGVLGEPLSLQLGRRPGSGLNNCTGAEQIGMHSRYEQEGLVPMVVDAVYAMAHSLENMLHRLCPRSIQIVAATSSQKLNGTRDHIRNVSFIGTSGNILRFQQERRPGVPVRIFQFQRRPAGKNASSCSSTSKLAPGGDDHLELDNSSLRWGTPDEVAPRSVCSEPCGFGYRTVAPNKEAATCCWECVPCDKQISDTSWGLVWTVFVLVVFVRYNNTPIIRASGRELCYVMLAGVSMSYCMTFIMLAPPTPVTCGFLRIFNGLSLSIIYSAIFTKTNRLSRIFNRGIKSLMKKPSYTSPKSQLILCCCLVSVQCRDHKVLRCAVDDVAIVVSLCCTILILIVLCTLYAFKTRNIPENFNEAKYIAFTMYSTCIVWAGVYSYLFRIAKELPPSVTVGCMFVPKIYIVLFKPHKNVRRSNASPAAGGGGASALKGDASCSRRQKSAAAGQWSSESQRSGRPTSIRREGREEPSERLALPADGGVASDSDSDSGAAAVAATSKAGFRRGNIDCRGIRPAVQPGHLVHRRGGDLCDACALILLVQRIVAGIAFLIAGRPKSEQQQQQQQQFVTYSPLTCQVSTQILGEDSDNYRDDNFALPDEIFANPCVRETAL
uniref:G_PROTEIN_RECEP_F3_4 domain-containing protein n=1 Tax=Macrostomum lignano TaxID=282301 RepID=A0A1I8JND7_9PLAT